MNFRYLSLIIVIFTVGCSSTVTHFDQLELLERERIFSEVHKYENLQPVTVTANISLRSAGSKHDFYSEGDYWWPNPKHPDSAYIRKDGLSNPDNFVAHRRDMIRLSQISGALASAYLISKDEKYIHQLMPHLNAWFVDETTKMNSNLLYAQAIKGRVTGRGIGIIDTIHLIEVALAVKVVEDSKLIDQQNIENIKSWFSEYLDWLTTHPYGIKERDNGNNHSTCWAMQVAAFAKLTNNKEQLEFCETFFKNVLLPKQMAEDGSFPKELSRTKPYGYSLFNLDAMASLAQLLTNDSFNFFNYESEKGRSLGLGINFLYPYIINKNNWPYKTDVMYWNDWPTKHPALLFGGLQLDNQNYISTWAKLPKIPNKPEIIRNMPVRYPLLWMNN
ncbi:alginate lyase family protein [Algibacter aquimarinus]|uniref:Alginate lyase domain-containing protein n=1 Tax=Algibacter aquimarinus TaxID=1136748 RepID=A0ABP9H1L0_9FLAO